MSPDKPDIKVLVTHCSKLTFSETFICAHLEELPFKTKFAEGAPPVLLAPDEVKPGAAKVFTGDEDHTRECREILQRFAPDVVLAEYGPTGVMWLQACEQESIPLVPFFHGFDAGLVKVREKFGERYRELLRYAKAVVAPSEALLALLKEWLPDGASQVVNPYGVDPSRFTYSPVDVQSPFEKLLFVGRFVEKKAPTLALEAAIPFLRKNSQRTLTMIGQGGLREQCIEIAEKSELRGQVIFPEDTSHASVQQAMARSDLLILPSQVAESGDCEGLPVVLLEAAASGLPILSTRHSGIPEFVENEVTGLLVDEGDREGLTAAIERFAADGQLRRKCAENDHQKVEDRFTLRHHIDRLAWVLRAAAE